MYKCQHVCLYLYLHRYLYTTYTAWYLRRPEDSVRSPGIRITNSSRLPRAFWELNLSLLQEQLLELLTAEPSLQPCCCNLKIVCSV